MSLAGASDVSLESLKSFFAPSSRDSLYHYTGVDQASPRTRQTGRNKYLSRWKSQRQLRFLKEFRARAHMMLFILTWPRRMRAKQVSNHPWISFSKANTTRGSTRHCRSDDGLARNPRPSLSSQTSLIGHSVIGGFEETLRSSLREGTIQNSSKPLNNCLLVDVALTGYFLRHVQQENLSRFLLLSASSLRIAPAFVFKL